MRCWTVALLGTLAGLISAQTPPTFRLTFSGPSTSAGPPIIGQPYCGDEVSERRQTLSDGTHIVQKQSERRLCRDSQGRTRSERSVFPADPSVKIIEIRDPVAGLVYSLNTENKEAHRLKTAPYTGAPQRAGAQGNARGGGEAKPTATAAAINPNRTEFSNESLGTQMVEGMLAEGHRTTSTVPVGTVGNDRPLVSTSELWFSTDLRVAILSKHFDPRMGETETRLTNITRTEPDPSLFQVPADYKILEEQDRFNVVITRP